MSQIVDINQMQGLVEDIFSSLTDNLAHILVVVGFIIGLSIVGALIDTWKEDKYLTDRMSRRRHL